MTQREWINEVVWAFYDKARIDILIGYHFRNIPDFNEHIPRIVAFWEIQLLGSTDRELKAPFDIINVHLPLGIKSGEVGRWLVLFRKTLDEKAAKYPEMKEFKEFWEVRLKFFEGVFLRFFSRKDF